MASALLLDQFILVPPGQWLDLWAYSALSGGPVLTKLGVSTVCALPRSTEYDPGRARTRHRPLAAVGRLVARSGVWLR